MNPVEVGTIAQLGAVVRRLRHDRGWSQTELAEAAGVSRVFVSQLENGKARAQVRLVMAVVQTLGATITIGPGANDGPDEDLLGPRDW